MPNISRANLQDKDIRNLKPSSKDYKKAVGNPKELYIKVYSSGMKTFFIKYKNKLTKLKEFREGIYSVAQARKDAIRVVKMLEDGFNPSNKKYLVSALFDRYIDKKAAIDQLSKTYLDKIVIRMNKYILPKFGSVDIKDVKFNDIREVLIPLFNPHNPKKSRLETIHRTINHLNALFEMAIKDRYIDYNPCQALHDEFPSANRFNIKNGIDTRYPAITDEKLLKELLIDLRNDNVMDLQTKRAVMLQILCVNRPINTANVKWEHLNLEQGIWTIPQSEMKMFSAHTIALSKQAIKIFKEQRQYVQIDTPFVFPAPNKEGHIHRDTIGKAIRNLGTINKYNGIASSHGFRATFKTICSLNLAYLGTLGISEKTIENALAHKEPNSIKYAYERKTATLEQNRILMQWYADYLNSLIQFV